MHSNESIDGLIWIGKSYHRILCRAKRNCSIPFKSKGPHCYVHEAEWRGCCRKVPQVPAWAVPGKTRIFLAHRDNPKTKHRGKIFGYFVLHRIELITSRRRSFIPPVQNVREINVAGRRVRVGRCWNGSRIDVQQYIDGGWDDTDEECSVILHKPECKNGDERKEKCWDGSQIVTYRCVDGFWEKTNKKCPGFPDPPPECIDGKTLSAMCLDGSVITTHICIEGKWEPTDGRCPKRKRVPFLEEERSCSLRLLPGSVYLVDARTSEVTDRFTEAVEKEGLIDGYIEAETKAERQQYLRKGRKLFKQIVEKTNCEGIQKTQIPDNLKGKAELRGELVLFINPHVYEKYPRADFKGLQRVDGDRLIEQIACGDRTVSLPLCGESWDSRMAEDLKVSKAFLHRLIDRLAGTITEELKTNQRFRLRGLGIFKVTERKGYWGRNPQNGEKIFVPRKKVVRFKPSKGLMEKINHVGD